MGRMEAKEKRGREVRSEMCYRDRERNKRI